jgi:hypothetical protein
MDAGYWHNLKHDLIAAGESWGNMLELVMMDGQLHTAAEAARALKVRESWLETRSTSGSLTS